MESSGAVQRLEDKTLDGQFLWELQSGFELSPRESSLILAADERLLRRPSRTVLRAFRSAVFERLTGNRVQDIREPPGA